MIIEPIEGKPLGKSFETSIFGPLGMKDSYLWNDGSSRDFGLPKAFVAPPYADESTDWYLSQGWAAGGVISTVDDMHRFMSALASGRLFKSPATLEAMKMTVPTEPDGSGGYGIGLERKAGSRRQDQDHRHDVRY